MNSQRNMWLKVWSAIAGVFVLGSITGAAVDGVFRARASGELRPASIRDGAAYFQVLDRELKLNPEQASGIQNILDQTRNEYKAVCADVRPRYDRLRDSARGQMRALLDPDQQQRFDAIVTQENCNCPDQTLRQPSAAPEKN